MTHSYPRNPARLVSGWGPRKAPGGVGSSFHRGWDLAAPKNYPVYASDKGTVVFARYNGTAGNHVRLRHTPSGSQPQLTGYMHMRSIEVSLGQSIAKGQVIGHVGLTGASTGYHLHWECGYPYPTLLDPQVFMVSFGDGRVIGESFPAGGSATPLPVPVPPSIESKAITMLCIATKKNRPAGETSYAAATITDDGVVTLLDYEDPKGEAKTKQGLTDAQIAAHNEPYLRAAKLWGINGSFKEVLSAEFATELSDAAARLAKLPSGSGGTGITLAQLQAALAAADDDTLKAIAAVATQLGLAPAKVVEAFKAAL